MVGQLVRAGPALPAGIYSCEIEGSLCRSGLTDPAAFFEKQAYIADTNLKICFPELDAAARQALLLKSIRVGLKTFMGFGELSWRSKARLTRRIKVTGWEHVQAEQSAGRPVILVVPHTWAVDMIGRYFSMMGMRCAP